MDRVDRLQLASMVTSVVLMVVHGKGEVVVIILLLFSLILSNCAVQYTSAVRFDVLHCVMLMYSTALYTVLPALLGLELTALRLLRRGLWLPHTRTPAPLTH